MVLSQDDVKQICLSAWTEFEFPHYCNLFIECYAREKTGEIHEHWFLRAKVWKCRKSLTIGGCKNICHLCISSLKGVSAGGNGDGGANASPYPNVRVVE